MGMQDDNNFRNLSQLGDRVQDIIEEAVNSRNYQEMNQSITQAVNRTILQYQTAMRKNRQTPVVQKKEPPAVYAPLTGQKVRNVLLAVFGGVITGGMAITLFTVLLVQSLTGHFSLVETVFLFLVMAVGIGMLTAGCGGMGRTKRFRKYVRALGTHTYCDFEQLSQIVGKPVKYVKKDVRSMISSGWFLEGHVDREETCLITSNETYEQYQAAQKQLEQRKKQQAAEQAAQQAKRGRISPEVQEVLDRGNEFLRKIKASNDAIPGEEISAKISRMEQIIQHIFKRAEEHPEIVPDLKRLMDYYLPMTVKLLDAYEEMDKQPVQGENIRSSKKEIEDTMDTLNTAFEKLLDSVFQDTAWDVSSDITVLHTVLAQEGLTEDDFKR